MKILKIFGIALVTLGMVTACEKSTNEINMDNSIDLMQSSQESITVGFNSKFYTIQVGDMVVSCGGPGVLINNQWGEGKATHLKNFTTEMEFCYNLNAQGPDPDSDYPTTPYWEYTGGTGKFFAANGDELWFEMAGRVYIFYFDLTDLENTDLRWDDPFIFTGGTGRFEGASGGGTTNSYTDDGVVNNHNWTGKLILKKGSK